MEFIERKFEEFCLDGTIFFNNGDKVSYDEFIEKFIGMLEDNGMCFGGAITHYEDGEEESSTPTADCFGGFINE